MKKVLKQKHDRSLSLDCENDSLNSSCLSNKVSFLESYKKNKLSRINSISLLNSNQKSNKKQPQPQQYTKNLLEDITLHSTNNSPQKNKSMLSFLCVSQASSALKTSKSTDSRKERKNENLSKAITSAIGIQQEKDKNLLDTKEALLKENELSKIDLQDLEARTTRYKRCFSVKKLMLLNQLKEIQKRIPHEIQDDLSNAIIDCHYSNSKGDTILIRDKREVVKSIQANNHKISKGLAYMQNVLVSQINQSNAQAEMQSIIATLSFYEKRLKEMYAEKDLLVHKVFEAEDRHSQLRETKMMLEEDFHSNVEQLTEYVAWQEDLESYVDHLRWKNPDYFDKLQTEIANAEKQMSLSCKIKELENTLSNKKEEYQQKQIDHLDLKKLHEDENNHYNCYIQMKDLILEDIFKREKTLFFIFYKSYHQFRKQYDLHQLFAYLKLFDLNLQALQQESDDSTNILMEYHYIMLNEIEEVISYIQDTQNLENTLSTLQTKSREGEGQQHPVLQTIQNQGIFRKVQMKERLAKIQEQKTKLYSGAEASQNAQDLLRDHKKIPLLDVCQDLSSRFTTQQQQFLKEMLTSLFALAQKKKENYQAFFDLKNSIEEKSKQLSTMQSKIQLQKKELESLKTQVLNEETQIAEIHDELLVLKSEQKEIEELYTELSKKEREKIYSNYLVDNDGYFKKVKFQFGDNYLTKIEQSVLDDFTNVSQKNFSKKKAQIAEINFILRKLEKQQEVCNQQIEHIIPKQFEQVKTTLSELEAKIVVLNKELLEQLFEERELVDSLEKSIQEEVLSFREDLKQLLESIFDDAQSYKTDVLHSICQIIKQMLLPTTSLSEITPAHRRELESAFTKLQGELNNITEIELEQVNVFEEKVLLLKAEIAEKEENIKKIDEQLKSTRRMYNLTESVLKEKTNTINTIGTTISGTSNLNKSNDTSLNLGSFAQGSLTSGSRTVNSSPFTKHRSDKGLDSDCKSNFPGSLIKPRDRSKPLRSPYDYLSPKESCFSSGVNTHRHGISTDISSSRSFPRVQSIATLHQQQSVVSSFGGISNMSLTKSPSMAQISSSNRSMMVDAQDTYDNTRANSQPNAPKKFDLESYLCSQEKECIEKSIKVLEDGIVLFKKFASNNGLAIKSADPNTPTHRRGNSASKSTVDTEPKGYGKRVMKLNKFNRTVEIFKFKPFSDKKTLEYYYDFKYITKIFYPAVLIDIIRKLRNQKNKENEKIITLGKNTAIDMFANETLLPFGVEVQNRGRIEFLIGELESLKSVSTCISYIIRAKST